jgi:hypothetical protein
MEIKPCPFCGAQPTIEISYEWSGGSSFYAACENPKCPMDGVHVEGMITKQEAIDVWNTRWQPTGRDD